MDGKRRMNSAQYKRQQKRERRDRERRIENERSWQNRDPHLLDLDVPQPQSPSEATTHSPPPFPHQKATLP
ncbi:hypothetical protein BT69DRAFT_1283308 [Atractiella rhizophila]|nr:hypothetical protein BT69DRAFT_1283308 [Atractiella rhizophila]